MLGDELRRGPVLDLETARQRIVELGERYGLRVDPDAKIEDLSVGQQQRVELLKALFREADILILDEPTAVLTPGEVEEFFAIVRSLIDAGQVDRVHHPQAARGARGRRPHHGPAARARGRHERPDVGDATDAGHAHGRPGRELRDRQAAGPARTHPVGSARPRRHRRPRVRLGVGPQLRRARGRDLRDRRASRATGSASSSKPSPGMRTPASGTIEIERRRPHRRGAAADARARRRTRARGPQQARHRRRVHHRRQPGAEHLLPRAVRAAPDPAAPRRSTSRHRSWCSATTSARPSIHSPVSNLSGGNQQKVIIARELTDDLKLLLVAQPTRGLDVGSIEFIHRRIVDDARRGHRGPARVSAELDEIFTLADRIGVLYRGELVGEFDRADATRDAVGLLMASGRDAQRGEPRDARANGEVAATRCTASITRYFDIQPILVPICRDPARVRGRRRRSSCSSARTRSPRTGRCCAACSAARTRSRHRSGGRRRSSAPRSRSRSRSAPACSTSVSRASCSIGATVAAWVGHVALRRRHCRRCVAVLVVLIAGVFGGGLYGAVPGVLKARTGAHEVITTIMLNSIAILYVRWMVGSQDPVILRDMSASVPRTALAARGRAAAEVRHERAAVALGLRHHARVVLRRVVRAATHDDRLRDPDGRRQPERGALRGRQRRTG